MMLLSSPAHYASYHHEDHKSAIPISNFVTSFVDSICHQSKNTIQCHCMSHSSLTTHCTTVLDFLQHLYILKCGTYRCSKTNMCILCLHIRNKLINNSVCNLNYASHNQRLPLLLEAHSQLIETKKV